MMAITWASTATASADPPRRASLRALEGRWTLGWRWGALVDCRCRVGLAAALLVVSRVFWKLGLRNYSGASA